MSLSDKQIKRLFDTLVKIVEDRENVKINYKLVNNENDNQNSSKDKILMLNKATV